MGILHLDVRGRRFFAAVLLALVFAFGGAVGASPAAAHGGGETEEGYALIQQALGHLAHDTSHTGISLAIEKIDDALRTNDQEGVDVSQLEQAKTALEAGRVAEGRALLQRSIAEATGALKPAVGEETGTKIVLSPLPGRGDLSRGDWAFLAVSALLVFVGTGLAWRFGPEDSIRQLRRRLGNLPGAHPLAESDSTSKDAS